MPAKTRSTQPKNSKQAAKRSRSRAIRKSANLDYVYTRFCEQFGPLKAVEFHDPLDLVVFSLLLQGLPLPACLKAFRSFKSQFVDWNEVRISTAKEVQDVVRDSKEALELAIFIKRFLHRLFNEHHHVSLDFLRELSISDIRSFFKKSPGFAEATVNLLLERLKEYPVVPLASWMEPCLERLGHGSPSITPLQRQKDLFEQIPRERVFPLHAYLAEHARTTCVAEDSLIDCPRCVLKRGCPYPRKSTARRSPANGSSATRS